jgi:hypothetical protein
MFAAGCGLIVLGSTLVREWRLAVDLEQAFAADAMDFPPVDADAEGGPERDAEAGSGAELRL